MLDPTAGLVGAYPPSAFYFRVVFAATALMADTSFQEVSGMNAEMETEEVVEGGENRYVQRLPKGVKHPPLELKRGMASVLSPLVRWCRLAMEGELMAPVVAVPLTVYLMNADKFPIRAWLFADAFPIKWEVEAFSSTKNEVAIEKIVLSYTYSYRII